MSGTWYDSWRYRRGPLRVVPRFVSLNQSERIHDILCRISRRRRIDEEEARAIALRRAERTSWGGANTVVNNLGRNWWGYHFFYKDGELRHHNMNSIEALREAIAERRPFLLIEVSQERRDEYLYQAKYKELAELETLLSQLRKEIRT